MPGCGYVCPACNDRQILDTGEPCHWCVQEEEKEISDEEWINQVHEGPCCSDIGTMDNNQINKGTCKES